MAARRIRTEVGAIVLALLAASSAARGDDTKNMEAEAHADFLRATALVRDAHWAEALDAFERAAAKRPHPVTTYNIGACERALGRYTRARRSLKAALDAGAESGALPASIAGDARAYLGEIDRLLATVHMHLSLEGARVSVDGRPLTPAGGGPSRYEAGLLAAGRGEPTRGRELEIVVDPGAHVFVVESAGHSMVVVQRVLAPAGSEDVPVELQLLPATIDISASAASSTVTIDGARAGTAPLRVNRAPGPHRVVVSKPGYTAYDTWITCKPGEETKLRATLSEEHTAITKRWWFWTAAGVVVVGAATGTYFATRSPAPASPPDGGSLRWNVTLD